MLTPSLRTDGVPSTASLASLRPRPVSALTTLITLIFLSPESTRTMLNSVFSSAAAAPPAATAPPATITGAALTPNFSSNSFTSSLSSSTERLDINSNTSSFVIAIFNPYYFLI